MNSRNNLPEKFAEFAGQRQASFLKVKGIKEKGIPVIGSYCTYFPKEIAMAMGAVTVGLCGTSEEPIQEAQKDLPKNLCPLIQSSYGFAKTDTCPYFYFSDLVVGETTCDGKKKMFEFLGRIKDVHVMHLPNVQDEAGKVLWKGEILRLKERLEEKFGISISDESVRLAVRKNNQIRKALKEFCGLMKQDQRERNPRDRLLLHLFSERDRHGNGSGDSWTLRNVRRADSRGTKGSPEESVSPDSVQLWICKDRYLPVLLFF